MTDEINSLDKKAILFVVNGKTPWVNEPDFWTEHSDDGEFHLLAVRNTEGQGAWCGYVGMSEAMYGDFDEDFVPIHGGWTGEYRGNLARKGYRYPGFDCDHAVAMRDGYADLTPRDHARGWHRYGTTERCYRTLPYVIAELRGAVVQIRGQRSWWKRLLRWLGRLGR